MHRSARSRARHPKLVLLVAIALVLLAACEPRTATVTGPITGGGGVPQPANLNGFDLGEVGYRQAEYYLSGSASAYAPSAGPLTSDGKWSVVRTSSAKYKTRAIVFRPIDPNRFNGTVIVEWLNVSGGVDADPDWTMTHNQLIRGGYAYVGVSAQLAGLTATKNADPERYASLHHPGDSYSYDIFSQAGKAVRESSSRLLGGLTPKAVIAAGESQSASRMVTYIDAVQKVTDAYDGFLVHSRRQTSANLSQAPQQEIPTPDPTRIRDDLGTPVFVFQTETDVFNGNTNARQADTDTYRSWEAAGTAHFDQYGLAIGPSDTGDGRGAAANMAAMENPTNEPFPGFTCDLPINTGGAHWTLNAVIVHLNRWVRNGTPPPIVAPLETRSTSPVVFAKDASGNTIGGVRSPHVDAPIAALGGTDNSGTGALGQFCRLFGTTVPYTRQQLVSRYGTHNGFVTAWNDAVERSIRAGFLMRGDAPELKASAAQSQVLR